jgi:hypothetical protein
MRKKGDYPMALLGTAFTRIRELMRVEIGSQIWNDGVGEAKAV